MASEEASSSNSAVAPAPADTPADTHADTPADTPTTAPTPAQDAAPPAPAKPKAKSKATAKTTTTAKGGSKASAAAAASKSYNSYNDDPALWIYTSLTAGNMHIVTATSRLETILRANRVPFKAVDLAVDDRARMLWGRRAGKAADGRARRLPALVQMGKVLGDIVEVEEWNEYGELKQHVKIYFDEHTQPAKGSVAPVPKYKQPADKAPHPPAALDPPPAAPREKSAAEEHANKVARAVLREHHGGGGGVKNQTRGVAEDAALRAKQLEQKAKQARLKALREKVGGAEKEEGEGAGHSPPTEALSRLSVADSTASPITTGTGTGLQSPTTGAWGESGSGGGGASAGEAQRAVQSPTKTTWVAPAESSLAEGTFAGARVASAPAEEIARVETQTSIPEVPGEEAV
ncbi:hypothetical protein VPNG_01852 [Cytospora leucostoma]|uniref:Glutaredoxin domain-containing protein n=1 Tax=Cytospora leucostoma TaxID=1230097 RepID=A0A423XIU3_9PEZI|nr:hypothetical protein VPNG_01852 [Cytospora leucostoma]